MWNNPNADGQFSVCNLPVDVRVFTDLVLLLWQHWLGWGQTFNVLATAWSLKWQSYAAAISCSVLFSIVVPFYYFWKVAAGCHLVGRSYHQINHTHSKKQQKKPLSHKKRGFCRKLYPTSIKQTDNFDWFSSEDSCACNASFGRQTMTCCHLGILLFATDASPDVGRD